MSKAKEKNCRLCLEILDDEYNVIEETTTEIFEVLLLKMDLSISEQPLLCKGCMENIQEAFDFKSTCISVNERVLSHAPDRNSGELDIRDVYLKENENKNLAFNEDYNICRLCLQCLEKTNFNISNDIRKNLTGEMLLDCIPELDRNIIKEPVVCTACMKHLESYYSLVIKCRNTEENIMKYCRVQEAEWNAPISLSSVLKFVVQSVVDCSNMATLKGEDSMFQNKGDTDSNINNVLLKIKEEELIIKDENKCEDHKTEEYRCDETKQKDEMLTRKQPTKRRRLYRIYEDYPKLTVHKCDVCNYETRQKNRLRKHTLTHKNSTEVVMYKCEKCPFETKYKDNIKIHSLIHKDSTEVTMHKCNLCNYESKWKNNLKDHMLTHDNSSDVVMYRCEKCAFTTKHKTYVKKHMAIHKDSSEVTLYKCNLCNYESKWKCGLKHHMLTHRDSSDIVMYKCESCTFETKRKGSLKAHKLVHKDNSEVTMHMCNLCSYKSKRKNDLKKHQLIHQDLKLTAVICDYDDSTSCKINDA